LTDEEEAVYPLPKVNPKLLGIVVQRYTTRSGKPSKNFQNWIDNIYNTMTTQFVPMLETIKMTSPKVNYSSIIGNDAYCLAEINDFAALAAISQNNKTPTFALTDEQLGYAGKVKDTQKERIVLFKNIYASFADHVIKLTSDESSH